MLRVTKGISEGMEKHRTRVYVERSSSFPLSKWNQKDFPMLLNLSPHLYIDIMMCVCGGVNEICEITLEDAK